MSNAGKAFIQVYLGHKDLSRTNTSSGHFTLYRKDKVVGHVLAGSIQDACRYFIPLYNLRGIKRMLLSEKLISFRGYDGVAHVVFSVRRTRWRSSFNSPLIQGYGHEYINKQYNNKQLNWGH